MGKTEDITKQRQWSYTLEDIAQYSGNSIHTVRDHKQLGMLKPWDMLNVVEYIQAGRVVNSLRSTGNVFDAEDEYGNPIRTN